MKKVYCRKCEVTVMPRKELTNRAKRDNIPDEDLGKYIDAFVTIWTGKYKCPNCGAVLDSATPEEEK